MKLGKARVTGVAEVRPRARSGPAGLTPDTGPGVPELLAGATLLQARPDRFQTQLARLGERGAGGGEHG